jgi:hypothetical protein
MADESSIESKTSASKLKELEIQTGLVAVLDILGYENLLERKKPEYVAREVIEVVNNAPTTARELIAAKMFRRPHNNVDERMLGLRPPAVFSDTIVLSCHFAANDAGDGGAENRFRFAHMCMQASLIYCQLFAHGLPLRGAIAYGAFYLEGVSLAGRPVVDALKCGRNTDAAAIVFSDDARRKLNELDMAFSEWLADEYLMPLKGGEPQRLLVLNPWRTGIAAKQFPLGKDIRQAVLEAFWGHGKDIPPAAYSKLFNTEMLFRFQTRKPVPAARDELPNADTHG